MTVCKNTKKKNVKSYDAIGQHCIWKGKRLYNMLILLVQTFSVWCVNSIVTEPNVLCLALAKHKKKKPTLG